MRCKWCCQRVVVTHSLAIVSFVEEGSLLDILKVEKDKAVALCKLTPHNPHFSN